MDAVPDCVVDGEFAGIVREPVVSPIVGVPVAVVVECLFALVVSACVGAVVELHPMLFLLPVDHGAVELVGQVDVRGWLLAGGVESPVVAVHVVDPGEVARIVMLDLVQDCVDMEPAGELVGLDVEGLRVVR